MRTAEQEHHLIAAVRERVTAFFGEFPAPAHGIEHVARVATYAKRIAHSEGAASPFLCELAGLLHDIGRVPEHFEKKSGGHHELSYQLLQEWFREGFLDNDLTEEEKKELLYAVRYHWNNVADDYESAWILRDADKLDSFGTIGIERMEEFFGTDNHEGINQNLRNVFDMHYWVRTAAAKKIMEEDELMEPIEAYYKEFLAKKISPISL